MVDLSNQREGAGEVGRRKIDGMKKKTSPGHICGHRIFSDECCRQLRAVRGILLSLARYRRDNKNIRNLDRDCREGLGEVESRGGAAGPHPCSGVARPSVFGGILTSPIVFILSYSLKVGIDIEHPVGA